MAVDKLVDSTQLNNDLTSVANAIRTRGGTSSQLAFPNGFVSAVGAIGNQYSAADEGKVVSSGALVSQTSDTVTTNDTYDTTLINSLTVNVSGGGGDTLQATLDRTISGAVSIIGISGGTGGTDQYRGLFYGCTQMTSLTYTNWGCIPQDFARDCTNLTYVSMPDAKAVGQTCFRGCSKLEEANFPILETTNWGYSQHGESLFYDCPKLTTVNMPKIKRIASMMFYNCYLLPAFESDQADQVIGNAFYNCRALQTLILRNETMMTLANVNAFSNTPFRGYGGTYSGHIYVPQALISSYEGASNWSTLVASYPGLFTAIEGSSYEHARLDGTPLTS